MPTTQEHQHVKRKKTVADFADEWGVSRMTIYRLIAQGRLEATKIGNQWRLDPSATIK